MVRLSKKEGEIASFRVIVHRIVFGADVLYDEILQSGQCVRIGVWRDEAVLDHEPKVWVCFSG